MGICVSFLLQFLVFLAHDFHVSKTDVSYDIERQRYELTMHVFIDDLELAIKQDQAPEKELHLGTPKEVENADSLIFTYVKNSFEMKSEDDLIQWNYVGREMSDDYSAFWIYMQSDKRPADKTFEVRNAIFMNIYDDQQNLLMLELPQQRKHHYIFRKGKTEQTISP